MDKVKVTIKKLDGTETVVEGSPEDVAKILRELDSKQVTLQQLPCVPYVPAPVPAPNPLAPYPWVQPIWYQTIDILPDVPGWPVITCYNT